VTYREVEGEQFFPTYSQRVWNIMRNEFIPQRGDIFVCGALGSGKATAQLVCLALLQNNDVTKVDMGKPYTVEMAMCRGRIDIVGIQSLGAGHRVFKMLTPLSHLAAKPGRDRLPQNVKIVVVIRDPRDTLVHQYEVPYKLQCTVQSLPDYLNAFVNGELMMWTYSWLKSYKEWWEIHKAEPRRVLWVVYEDALKNPARMVRELAEFVGQSIREDEVATMCRHLEFNAVKERFGNDFGPLLRKGVVGDYVNYLSNDDIARIRRDVLEPAIASGMRLPSTVHVDLRSAVS